MNKVLLATIIAAAACLACQSVAMAHGGSHPTPWPTPPPDTPPPPPTPPPPTPTPSPTPSPTPGPDGRTPTPTPTGPATTPTTPTKSGDGSISAATWKDWWEINKWRFTWTAQRQAIESGGTEGESQNKLVEFLVGQLSNGYYDIRSAAAIALGKAGDARAIQPLKDLASSDSNATVVESAILALGMLKAKDAIPLLIEIFKSQKQGFRFRVYSAVALGLIGDHSAAKDLMNIAVVPKEHDEVKAAALLGLALMQYEPGAHTMITVLSNGQEKDQVRAVAATALGKLGIHYVKMGQNKKVPVMKYLLQVLQTCKKEDEIRQSAILSIAALGPSADIPQEQLLTALLQVYEDKDDNVKCLTLMAIAELANKGKALTQAQSVFRSRLTNEKNANVKSFACLAAGLSQDRESIDPLRNILKGGANPDVRSAAAVGLGLLKDVGATPTLLEILNEKTDKTLKGYCCISLGLMGAKDNKEAMPKLNEIITTASDPELRAAAAMALTQLGDINAVNILTGLLNESNMYFKMSAVMAIGAFRDLGTVTPLINIFNGGSVNDETKAIIIVALGHIAEKGEVPLLRQIGLHYNFLLERCPTLKEIVRLL